MIADMRRTLETFSVPLAIVAAGLIIGASIVWTRLATPYEFAATRHPDPAVWRGNVMTGGVDICRLGEHNGQSTISCMAP